MTDEFPPHDWFPRPERWPSWVPTALRNGGLGPSSSPRDLPAWLTFDWEQEPSGGVVGRANRFGERVYPHWWESITRLLDAAKGGRFGHLLAPRDTVTGGLLGNVGAPWDGGGGLLGDVGTFRDSGGGGLLGNLGARRHGGYRPLSHLSARPVGAALLDPSPELKGVMPWDWSKLPIPSGLSHTHWPAPSVPATPPTSSIDTWEQDEFPSLERGRFNWVEETPDGGLLAMPRPQMTPSWLRSAMAFGTNARGSTAPAQPNDQSWESPSSSDAGPANWDPLAPPELSALSPTSPPESLSIWSDFYRSSMPFDADAQSPVTPAQQNDRVWPDQSLAATDQTDTGPPAPPGPSPLPPMDAPASPDIGRDVRWWQLLSDANARIPAASAHDRLWPDAALAIRGQSPWEFPTLPSATAMPHVTNSAPVQPHDPTTNLTGVVSDADPEAWIAGQRYANRTGRGTRGPRGRQLSPAEENLLWFYQSAHRTLRELDPNNRQLQSVSSETWIPRQEDINRLNEEIARTRREQGLVHLESHHTLPRQFASRFNKAGIDIQDYIVYLARDQHRYVPRGLHTGSENWNTQWARFFNENKKATPQQIQQQLKIMLDQISR